MKHVRCTGPNCGKSIVWAIDEKGQKIPLDTSKPIYTVTGVDPTTGAPTVKRAPNAMVSHFATCPDAGRFSGSR